MTINKDLPPLQDVLINGSNTQPENQTAQKTGASWFKSALFILGAALVWSTSFVVIKIGVDVVPPLTYGAIRFLIAAGTVSIIALFTRKVEPVPGADKARLALGGLLGITTYFALQNLGVQLTTASNATLVCSSFPALTMLVEIIVLRKRLSLTRFLGVAVTMGGVYLIIRQAVATPGANYLLGDLSFLGAGLAWAFYNLATMGVVQRYSMLTVIFWQTIFGALAFLPLALLESPAWRPFGWGNLLGMAYLGIICSVLAFLFYARGLKGLDAGSAVSLLNVMPVFGLILAIVTLGEQVSLGQVLGGVIILAGVSLSVLFS